MPVVRDLATARAPGAAPRASLYESHYLTAVDPAGGRAIWLRHTSLKPSGRPARGTVWLTSFDRTAGAPVALRVTAAEPVADPGGAWSRSSLGTIGPGRASGKMAEASWELRWSAVGAEVRYLPARWLYDRRFPRSGGVALIPHTAVSGAITLPPVGDPPSGVDANAAVKLEGWDGMVGHNWGSEHLEHWVWAHAGGFGEDRADWVDLVLARIRLGPLLTPWLASGAACLDGRRHVAARRGRAELSREGERTRLTVPVAGREPLRLELTAPAAATVHWDYASLAGRGRQVEHSSVADAVLSLGQRRWTLDARASLEHGSPLQPA